MTFEEMKALPPDKQKTLFNRLKSLRGPYKAANYSCIYGVGKAKLARELDLKVKDAAELIEAYWQRNWAVRELSKDQVVKTVGNEMWLYNPVSGFWYSLRYEKDSFSTLNQGTGVYVFDTWKAFVKKRGERVALEYHDEFLLRLSKGKEGETEANIAWAIEKTNEKIKLNVRIECDNQFGKTYAEVH